MEVEMNNYEVVISYSVYRNCDEELMYLNRSEDIDNGRITEFTEKDLQHFFKNNITFKKVGKGEQVIYSIKNLVDLEIVENIFYDIDHYARMHYFEYEQVTPIFSKSEHKKHVEILEKKFNHIYHIRKELKGG
tara:strand:- start:5723 stop:6121 length:399 start_codon:yes stop_codon:yes gene_type:complete